MKKGNIKSLVQDRGFGFVRDDSGTDFFFHATGCITAFNSLIVGQRVTFDLVSENSGRVRAYKVEQM